MVPVIEPLLTTSFGEGPHWDVDEQVLYYVNFTDNTINKYNPVTRENTSAEFDEHVSFIIPIEGKKHHFIGGMKRDIVEIEWNGENDTAKVVRIVAQVDTDKPINVLNDGKADPRGRLYTGTLGSKPSKTLEFENFIRENGAIYRLDEDGQVHNVDDKVTLANGLAWDVQRKYFYYVDSMDAIRRYDYDIETGTISNCQRIFVAAEHGIKGICDGMTIDTDGNLWVAVFDDGKIIQIEGETGKLLRKVTIPTNQVTSVAFGGPNLDILYVTSANTRCKKLEAVWGAALYEVTDLGVTGYPSNKISNQTIIAMVVITEAATISFGEGPHWDVDEQVLYYVNFLDNTINKYNPATRQKNKTKLTKFPETYTSFVIPIEGRKHRFLCGIKRDIVEIEWKGDNNNAVVVRTIASVEKDRPENFLNDGKADCRGRLITGTLGGNLDGETLDDMLLPEKGCLYRLDVDGQVHKLDDRITISNGLAWDADGRTLYHVDSMDCIRRYDYDVETGNISNCQRLFDPKDHRIHGICDGLTIDTDDNLWVAVYQGGKILKIDGKTGEILQKVTMPTMDVASLTFGGPNLDILYVTSSNVQWQINEPEWGAAIYEVKGLGVRGYPAFKAKLYS